MTTKNLRQSAAFPYAEVFAAIEKQVRDLRSKAVSPAQMNKELDQFKQVATSNFSDADYFTKLVFVAFYSGFRAATVTKKEKVIKKHFPHWQVVAEYGEANIKKICSDKDMIAHERKIRGCVNNARTFRDIVRQHGSFKVFLDQQLCGEDGRPDHSFERLMLLKELLETTFDYLGGITVYHFMTDIGLNVLKPDRVMCRLFKRLGLLDNESQLLKAIIEGRKFAAATDLPIRYIDIVLVANGQVSSPKLGIKKGVCLEVPRCSECSVSSYCQHYGHQGSNTAALV